MQIESFMEDEVSIPVMEWLHEAEAGSSKT
jgi:hypothetical protein